MYHPKPGCLHVSDAPSAKFISSLTNLHPSRHAPALDIDHPTTIKTPKRAVQIEITGPKPRAGKRNALLKVLASTGLMDSARAQSLMITTGSMNKRGPLHALPLRVPAKLVPSSSKAHFHLYIEHEMTWDSYADLLRALRDAEVIGNDFCEMCLHWRVSFLLKPGFTKKDMRVAFKAA